MSDVATPVASAPAAKKTKTPSKAKKTAKAASHPTYGAMIAAAIKALKERNGSSRQAILKYIVATYKVEAKSAGVHLRQAFRKGVASGAFVQVKGSFKLKKEEEKPKKVVKKSTVKKTPTKKAAAKKPAAKKVKKTPTKKAPAAKKPKVVKKSPAKKPKAAKKTAAKKPVAKKTAKKAAPKKASK